MKQPNRLRHLAIPYQDAGYFSFLNNSTQIHIPILKKLFLALSFFICIIVNSQTTIGRQKVDQYPITSWGTLTYGLTWLPTDYSTTTTKYPLIIFLHGAGEGGTGVSGLNNLIATGLPQIIANGYNVEATNPADGLNYKFIVVSPQAPEWSYTYTHVVNILADVQARYRVDPTRIYITGLSAGGAGSWSSLLHDDNFTQKFAAALPVSSTDANDPAEEVNLPYISSRNGVKLWSICGQYDAWLATAYRYQTIINSNSPVVPMVVTEIPGASHTSAAWNTAYNPAWRSNTFNLNVFEWMLKNKRGSTQVSNQPPIDNAGLDKTITLPTNSVTLTGSGSDPDGTIKTYIWSKISGPSQYTITSPSSASTTVTGLVQGIYIFRLTVTDNVGAIATDNVQVTVLGAANTPPIAKAGPDQTITLPTNSVTLAGSGTDADGTIASYSWSKISGPTQYAINNSNIANPVISNLVAGTYTFRLAVSDNQGATATDDMNIVVNSTSSGNTIPGRIQAESYSTMSGIQTEATGDGGTGFDVGYIDKGDWMDYNVNVTTAGTYTVNFRIATPNTGAQLQLRKADGTILLTNNLPVTGAWQTWQTVSSTVSLSAGTQTLRLYSNVIPRWNINWFEFVSSGGGANISPTANAGADKSIILPTNSVTLTGSGTDADGTIASYLWTKVSGPTQGTINSSRAAQTTLSNLAQGTYIFELKVTDNLAAIGKDSVTVIVNPATSSSKPIPGRIEAESYNTMSGVQTEATGDGGTGLDVGYIDLGDWMDYSVNVATAGTYTVNFRIATPNTGAKLQLRKADGTILLTNNLPATGAWQTWQTVSSTISLSAGVQTLRLYSSAAPRWNINWFEFVSGTGSSSTTNAAVNESSTTLKPLEIFPNPVNDNFVLQVNNTNTGTMKIQIVDMKGTVMKELQSDKKEQSTQVYLSANGLSAGTYFINVQIGDWNQSIQMVKL